MKMEKLLKLMWLWPAYLGAGVKVTRVTPDLQSVDVEMKLSFWNRNYLKTHFGGSLYSMTDPFYALMLMENLGRDYIVWDKAASIQFKKPGKGRVRAQFRLNSQQIELIRQKADQLGKYEPEFDITILDDSDSVVAEVHKVLYVRRKDKDRKYKEGRNKE